MIICFKLKNKYHFLKINDLSNSKKLMSKRFFYATLAFLFLNIAVSGQNFGDITIKILPDQGNQVISKNIYGQFSEHLGSCIYGGIWVGENSPIPNTNGYRNDVLNALKNLKIPVLRWPGGCFADEYHWTDGIGPREKRPKMVNNNWGGVVEDNSFGTHEFLNLCEMIGCEPYISGNVGSGSVEEMAKWVEYMTSDGDSPMANLRRANGRNKPWNVKYLGVGNESWGCGGNMRPEYYADLYRRYSTYCRNFDGNNLYKIASGASDYDYNWTDVLMKQVGDRMNGLSLHYYTIRDWNDKGSATQFNGEDYYKTLVKCSEIEDVLIKHIGTMDKYDPKKKIGLLVDEWGTWFDVEPGTNPGFLFQQNTLRDAFVAAISLNIFNKYSDRVRMANIAQIVNVLQSMILTKDDKMVLTPTYYIFDMYKVHQDATYMPVKINSDTKTVNNKELKMVTASASQKDGLIHITLTNADLDNAKKVKIDLAGKKAVKVTGKILTSKNVQDHNTFENPDKVKPETFTKFKFTDGVLNVNLPEKSIVVLEIK
ncbi:MAG: alpha-N-arabinofuranosidase [Bacteroidetes bacterium]|nr:alpha-N-arabinofuranosidase [Bacteroidota bacterium]